ncbi:hypothetical protein NDU88_004100 [Pleurodeles waltl]|uniref:Uncharacterized protein n=1 Tax=Pleurodeles waltl TaxID=8319 RepID=A0AAV7N240_PLEWA|nr:hypothetical protein NDU88_004100 [Pleurodeles waltl]
MTVAFSDKCYWELKAAPLLAGTKRDMSERLRLPLSVTGKGALIKMVAFPHFLYDLQHYPNPLPSNFFTDLQSQITNFLWAGKAPRVSFVKCRSSPYEAGLGWADVRLYYWVSPLIVINDWFRADKNDSVHRLELELLGPTVPQYT